MNTQTISTYGARSVLAASAGVAILLVFSTSQSFGQGEEVERVKSRDALAAAAFIQTGEISDDIDGDDDEYFYKLKAVAGKLTLTLEITATETNAGATLDLFGVNDKTILSNVLAQAADGGTERVSRSVNLAKAQDIVIRIKGMRYGSSASYPGIYKIQLEGTAINFKAAPPADGTVDVKRPELAPSDPRTEGINPDGPPSDGTVEVSKPDTAPIDGTVKVKTPDVTPADETVSDKKPTAAAPDKTGQNKKPDAVDRVIEKGKAKSNKLLELLNKVKEKIPD